LWAEDNHDYAFCDFILAQFSSASANERSHLEELLAVGVAKALAPVGLLVLIPTLAGAWYCILR